MPPTESNRDEFPAPVKRALALRVAHRCSYPGCTAVTVGPSGESDDAVSTNGIACHIAAAAPGIGARRYVASMTSEQRRSIDNGIWMCSNHGTIVDRDETRFTIAMLQNWRKLAEMKARYEQETGRQDFVKAHWSETFVRHTLEFNGPGQESRGIGEAMQDTCVEYLWGVDITSVARDAMIEIARNAFLHGGANTVKIEIRGHRVQVSDNGREYDPRQLNSERETAGGTASMRYIRERLGGSLIVDWRREADLNMTTFVVLRKVSDANEFAPCTITIDDEQIKNVRTSRTQLQAIAGCKTTYILLNAHFTPSDAWVLRCVLATWVDKKLPFVIVGRRLSGITRELLDMVLPGIVVWDLSE